MFLYRKPVYHGFLIINSGQKLVIVYSVKISTEYLIKHVALSFYITVRHFIVVMHYEGRICVHMLSQYTVQ